MLMGGVTFKPVGWGEITEKTELLDYQIRMLTHSSVLRYRNATTQIANFKSNYLENYHE